MLSGWVFRLQRLWQELLWPLLFKFLRHGEVGIWGVFGLLVLLVLLLWC